MTDQTMRSLLEVHRTEIRERDQKILDLQNEADGWRDSADRLERREAEWRAAVERAEAHSKEWKAKHDRRGEVIDSLKLELAEVRAQFTKAREAGDYSEATSEGNRA